MESIKVRHASIDSSSVISELLTEQPPHRVQIIAPLLSPATSCADSST